MDYFPGNTLTTYTTKLPSAIELEGEWEVGLSEIQYPLSWYNVREKRCTATLYCDRKQDSKYYFTSGMGLSWYSKLQIETSSDGESNIYALSLYAGQYDSPTDIIDLLNGFVIRAVIDGIRFDYTKTTKKCAICVSEGYKVELSDDLQTILGFPTDTITRGCHTATRIVDMRRGVEGLFVYTDAMRPHPVGDIMAPLLRILPIKSHSKDAVSMKFDNPHFYPVQTRNFDTISVFIRTDTGEPIQFQRGKVVTTLQFRKSRKLI